MKLAIIGSRTFCDYKLLCAEADKLNPTMIISGGAEGADRLAECYSDERGLELKVFWADWSNLTYPDAVIKTNRAGHKYDALAGMRRNTQIIEAADVVLAFHDGISKGTADSIRKAELACKPVVVIRF